MQERAPPVSRARYPRVVEVTTPRVAAPVLPSLRARAMASHPELLTSNARTE